MAKVATDLNPLDADLGRVRVVEKDAKVANGSGDHTHLDGNEYPNPEGHGEWDQIDFWKCKHFKNVMLVRGVSSFKTLRTGEECNA